MRLAPAVTATAAIAIALAIPVALSAQIQGENQVRFRAADIEVTLRFRDTRAEPLERQIREVMSGALEHYRRVFDGPPRAMDGTPTVKLTLNVAMDQLGGGDAQPGVLTVAVGREPAFGFYDWKLTLLHEAFHLWNGETFRYAGPAEQWFHEGMSEFYAAQTAARLGYLEPLDAVRLAAATVGFYTSATGQDRVSLGQAGQQKETHYFLVFQGGWTAALVLDRAIRERTANARSLDDVMRWMLAHHDRTARRYTTMDIARAVRESTGQDFTDFFARHVMGRLALPVSATLNLGELARSIQQRGTPDVAPPDSLLLYTLGLRPRR